MTPEREDLIRRTWAHNAHHLRRTCIQQGAARAAPPPDSRLIWERSDISTASVELLVFGMESDERPRDDGRRSRRIVCEGIVLEEEFDR